MPRQFDPPWTPPEALQTTLQQAGYALLDPAGVCRWAEIAPAQLDELAAYWERLPPDPHLRDGGRYRRRRHGCCMIEGAASNPSPTGRTGSRWPTTPSMGACSAGSSRSSLRWELTRPGPCCSRRWRGNAAAC